MKILKSIGIVFGLLSLLLYTCKQKDVVSPTLTTIKFQLEDDRANKVTGAKIYLFNSLLDWQNSKLNKMAINANDSTSSVDGTAQINIDPVKGYYLLVIYLEPRRNVMMLNVAYDSVITKTLPKNIDVSVRIKLEPVDGNLVFYTNDDQIPSPITITTRSIRSSKKETVILNARIDPQNIDFAVGDGQVPVRLDPGEYTYQATNGDGCSWSGKQTLDAGTFIGINLTGCNTGSVAFTCLDPNITRYPIQVFVNEVDDTNPLLNLKFDPTNPDTEMSTLSIGKYSYYATSLDGKCFWSGNFTVKLNQTTPVLLPICVP
jgi:hypothetical protein